MITEPTKESIIEAYQSECDDVKRVLKKLYPSIIEEYEQEQDDGGLSEECLEGLSDFINNEFPNKDYQKIPPKNGILSDKIQWINEQIKAVNQK